MQIMLGFIAAGIGLSLLPEHLPYVPDNNAR